MLLNKLTVYTRACQRELRELINNNPIFYEGLTGDLYYINFGYSEFDANGFIRLMQKIIINENPIVKSSHKVEEYISRYTFHDMDGKLERELKLFLAENAVLNLEGYARFRMWEYGHYLNIVLYSIVKKLYC